MKFLYKEGDHHGCYAFVENNGLTNDESPEIKNLIQDQIMIRKMYSMIEEM